MFAGRWAKHIGQQWYDDLLQEASLAVMHACEKYNPERATFSTYASGWIRAYLQRFVRTNRIIHVPEHRFWDGAAVPPDATTLPEKPLAGPVVFAGDRVLTEERAELVARVLRWLPERWALALRLMFGIGCKVHSFRAAAQVMGVTKERVRQLQEKAINRIRQRFSKELEHWRE